MRGAAKTWVESLQQHQASVASRFRWVSYLVSEKASWGDPVSMTCKWELKAPISADYDYLLRICVQKADCRLSGLENEGRGGWFLTGKLCAD